MIKNILYSASSATGFKPVITDLSFESLNILFPLKAGKHGKVLWNRINQVPQA
jgi:hypothetical protein